MKYYENPYWFAMWLCIPIAMTIGLINLWLIIIPIGLWIFCAIKTLKGI